LAYKIVIGNTTPPTRPEHRRVATLRVAAPMLLLAALGAAGFYAVNGFRVAPGQRTVNFTSEIYPTVAARRGFVDPLEAENARRQQHGLPLLPMPFDRHQRAAEQRPYLLKLQQQIDAMQNGSRPSAP